ncbi:MAG: flagellar filament capping protein FliD [Spirochaetes bacterium]|jgi:flagellar hook-associated protein 2|nr:flagellar filament capping protein FliD [Spirochaetota bacterium]
MPITMGGMASGIDTDSIITKLVEVEAQPIKKIEGEKNVFRQKKGALQNLETHLKDIEKAVKDLYGFRASYDDKKAISSRPEMVDAVATKMAKKGTNYITVLQLAGTHKITSDNIKKDKKLSAGVIRISVNDEESSLRFRGGTLEKLAEQLNESSEEQLTAIVVNITADEQVLVLESKIPGKKGEMRISGDLPFLKDVGLSDGYREDERDQINLVFDSTYFLDYAGTSRPYEEDGSLSVQPDGSAVTFSGVLWREYNLATPFEVKENSLLEFKTLFEEPEKEEDEFKSLPFKVETGPTESTTIKGIEIEGYNVSRERPIHKPERVVDTDDVLGVGIVYREDEVRKEELFKISKDVKDKQEIPIGEKFEGKRIEQVIFYSNSGEVTFKDAAFVTPLDATKELRPKNTVTEARNARLKIDDIELERETNDGINDVIAGVTLSLLRSDPEDAVEITIDNDIDKSVEKIKKFAEVYNAYLDYNSLMTKAGMTDRKNDYKKTKRESGPFVGDMTIIQLENSLKQTVSSAYPSRADNPIRLLSQIGVSTGEINASWETIKQGKIVIDDSKLRTSIMENPEGVQLLFGSDTDGDNRIDNGFAYTMKNKLRPYIMPGKSILAAKITLQDDSLERANERIEKLERHLKSYEDKLRRKFANMEMSISGSKSQSNWMKSQQGGQ